MRVLRASNHRRMAWKNGGGETVEVAVRPPAAGLANFDWRVSMARVAVDGPFSIFPGIDRTLAILDGQGLDLDTEKHGRRRLTAASDPLFFPADAFATARLVGGPVTDLNVMTRRGAWTHELRRLPAGQPATVEAESGMVLILCCEGEAEVRSQASSVRLGARDALLVEQPCDLSVLVEPGSRLYAIFLSPQGSWD